MKTELELPPLGALAKEIYRRLVRHVRAGNDSITYGELATLVSAKHPTHPRSSRLHAALGEVTTACRLRDLPILPAIVWRADAHHPSDGYYAVAHPRARSWKSQLAAWQVEHERVLRDRRRFPGAL